MRPKNRGFTLVEMLVVIAIIAILLALLLPAVHSVRESARQIQCKNHIKQLGLGALAHQESHGHFPTGGWAWRWTGDPDAGFGRQQPGGWLYNVLPFIEQVSLHQKGSGQSAADKNAAGSERLRTALSIFHCPSRRPAQLFSHKWCRAPNPRCYLNSGSPGDQIARTDYAACGGDMQDEVGGDIAHEGANYDGSNMEKLTESQWWDVANTDGPTFKGTGVIYRRSEIGMAHIRDGATNTYLLGERYLNTDSYYTDGGTSDDQGWNQGYDNDTVRWTKASYPAPLRDRPAVVYTRSFGSAHTGVFHMAFCDGSVHAISYDIDPTTHSRLGNRRDGLVVDPF